MSDLATPLGQKMLEFRLQPVFERYVRLKPELQRTLPRITERAAMPSFSTDCRPGSAERRQDAQARVRSLPRGMVGTIRPASAAGSGCAGKISQNPPAI